MTTCHIFKGYGLKSKLLEEEMQDKDVDLISNLELELLIACREIKLWNMYKRVIFWESQRGSFKST